MRSNALTLLIYIMLLTIPSILVGQSSSEEVDAQVLELEKKIEAATETERPRLSLELARLVQGTDPERTLALVTDILETPVSQSDLRLTADAYKVNGIGHLVLDQHQDVLDAMREAESLYRQLGDELEAAKCLGYQGIAQSDLGEIRPAIESLQKAQKQ